MEVPSLALLLCLLIPLSSQSPISTTNDLAGISTDPNMVKFLLYPNPANPNDFDEIKMNDLASVTKSRFDSGKNNIFYSSGFMQNSTTDQAIKNAYLKAGFTSNTNIFVVDYGHLSGNKAKLPAFFPELALLQFYNQASDNVDIVGKRVEEFINFLMSNGKISGPEKIHLVGQSLGAHVSGKAGFYYKKRTGKLYARITACEAANQLFQGSSKDKRVDAGDAEFVDTVHTNDGGYGYSGDFGTVDFYVNGGKAPQPGCDGSESFCSHNLAVQYFAKSIVDKSLRAYECLKCPGGVQPEPGTPFGQYAPTSARGPLYITTDPHY